ncbi:hypothetical protein PRK78_002332 [Emydomyces testavorans]|uniref:ORC6 first cyclin-like domain-containing protein n=1 Tax=Emydomyces testavorans TaxID=2070801 RepID=A0AAF0IHH8_9EURO|nr:hypothetical protein PRK78_002332 [Emydomyces testavorans]
MSLKATEPALASLLPTLAECLPDELVKLAACLLAQSRSHGGSLKPDEEIARPYACAEIACKRLSKPLKLPPAVSRPPCPPRIYKKLYVYLEQVLSTSSTGAKRQENNEALSRSTRAAAQNKRIGGPGTSSTMAAKNSMTPSKSTKRARVGSTNATTFRSSTRFKDAPSWTTPIVRKICSDLAPLLSRLIPAAPPNVSASFPPHIFAGLSSLLRLIAREFSDKNKKFEPEYEELLSTVSADEPGPREASHREGMITLIIAIYFIVIVRRLGLGDSANLAPGAPKRRKLDLEMFNEVSTAALISADLTAEQSLRNNVDLWIKIIVTRGWMNDNEWFESIPELNDVQDSSDEQRRELEHEDDKYDIISPKKRRLMNRYVTKLANRSSRDPGKCRCRRLLPGLGTMMHDQVDWLSDEKRAEYVVWKERIMEWIREIETGAVVA